MTPKSSFEINPSQNISLKPDVLMHTFTPRTGKPGAGGQQDPVKLMLHSESYTSLSYTVRPCFLKKSLIREQF